MSLSKNFPVVSPTLLLDFANTRALDPRITFARNSPGTYYDGITTAVAEQNLLPRSQELNDAVWTTLAVTVVANTTAAPDLTVTADTVTETVATGVHGVTNFSNSAVTNGLRYVFSVFAKKGIGATAPDIIQLSWASATAGFASTSYANFNINLGTVTASGAGVVSTAITAFGSGWFRCVMIADATSSLASVGLGVFFTNNNGTAVRATSYAGSTTSDVYLWGAQLEQRSAATAYTATTTVPITNYVPVLLTAAAGVARFDANPVTGLSLGLLIEGARTNLRLFSQDISNANGYGTTSSTLTTINIQTPISGVTTATLATLNAGANPGNASDGWNFSSTSLTNSTVYTQSIYAKPAGTTTFRLRSNVTGALFDFALTGSGTAPTASGELTAATIQSVGNSWYRLTWTFTTTTSAPGNRMDYWALKTNIADGVTGMWVTGAQLEAGAFATTYIATAGTTQTREADTAAMTGTNFSSWYNAGEGTFFLEGTYEYQGASSFPRLLAAVGDPNSDEISIYTRTTGVDVPTAGQTFFSITVGLTQVGDMNPSGQTVQGSTKSTFAYELNDLAATTFTRPVITDNTSIIPVCTALRIYGQARFQSQPTGIVKKIAYYNVRLTNAQLATLTAN
jgi:hypothetical protein